VPSQVYDGPIKVYDKKADGTPLVIGKGDRIGEPYYKVSFQVDGGWVNLMDFEGITDGVSGDYHVEYYQKFNQKGEPELYNDKPQYQLESIIPAGGPRMVAPGGWSPPSIDRDESIRSQTSLKVAGAIYSSILGASEKPLFDDLTFRAIYTSVKATLDDASALLLLKQALDATPADADDRPEQGDPDDEDIPF